MKTKVKIFVWLLLIVKTKSEHDSQQAISDENDIEDDCRRLDPIPKRTSVNGESHINLIDFLGNGTSELFASNQDIPQDVILVLGNTGSGKTTLTQMIAGDLTKLHAVLTHSGQLVIVDDLEKIGAPSITSRTIIPELVVSPDGNFTFYDCPGFDDTRGPLKDLAANFFVNQIIQKVSRVKLLFLVTHSSVQLGNDRLDFDLLANHATHFIKNLYNFEASIGLVVTKVNGFSNRNGRLLSDKQILRSIVEFLTVYKNHIQASLPNEKDESKRDLILKKSKFVEILLTKEKESYPHLTFSKNPDSCGPLNESPVVASTRKRVTRVLQSLEFSLVGNPRTNFGFTLKDSTLLKVRDYTRDLNNAITHKIADLMVKVKDWYDIEYIKDTQDLPIVDYRLLNIWGNVDNFDKSDMLYPLNVASEVSIWFSSIGFEYPGSLQGFMAEKESYFEFFDLVSGRQVERKSSEWLAPIEEMQARIKQDKEAYRLSILSKWVHWANDRVVETVENEMKLASEWLDKEINKENSSLPLLSASMWDRISNNSNILNHTFSSDAFEFGAQVQHRFKLLGYQVSPHFEHELTQVELALGHFEDFLKQEVNREVERWKAPILALKHSMSQYKSEYVANVRAVYVPEANNKIQSCLNNMKTIFNAWFVERKAAEQQNYPRISAAMQKIWSESETLLIVSTVHDPVEFFMNKSVILLNMGMRENSSLIESCVQEQKNHLEFFDVVAGERVTRSSELWIAPMREMQQDIESYKREYLGLVESKFVAQANNRIMMIVNETIQDFYSWTESNLIRTYDNINGIDVLMANIVKLRRVMTATRDNFSLNFVDSLRSAFEQFTYHLAHQDKFDDAVSLQLSNLQFFDEITKSSVNRKVDLWRRPLDDFVTKIDEVKGRSISRARQFIAETNEGIVTQLASHLSDVKNAFEGKITRMNVSSIKDITQQAYFQISAFESSVNLSVFVTNLQNALQPFGFKLPNEFTRFMADKEQFFTNLEQFPEISVTRLDSRWSEPVRTFSQDIYKLKIWYEFCEQIQSKLSNYGFQASKPSPSVLSSMTWIEFLDRKAYIAVSPEIQSIGTTNAALRTDHFKKLTGILDMALQPEQIKCENDGETITVTGLYICLSKIIDKNGNLERSGCYDVKYLELYATERIFIDANLRAVGKELSVVFVAPSWEVVGSPHIDLNGKAAGDHTPRQADNGRHWGLRGSNGRQGLPGGPGGSFLGIASQIGNPGNLRITANGGRGGRGQDGGNGANGRDGQNEDFNKNDFNILIVITGSKGQHGGEGEDGGNGGWGGEGGTGGKPGNVKIIAKDSHKVKVEADDGDIGEEGIGGNGGLGGRGSTGESCRKLRIIGIPIPQGCTRYGYEDGSDGINGRDGGASDVIYPPKQAKPSKGVGYAKSKFQKFYGQDASKPLFN